MTPEGLEAIGRVVCALSGGGQVSRVRESGRRVHVHMLPRPRRASVSVEWARRRLERIQAMAEALDSGLDVVPLAPASDLRSEVAW